MTIYGLINSDTDMSADVQTFCCNGPSNVIKRLMVQVFTKNDLSFQGCVAKSYFERALCDSKVEPSVGNLTSMYSSCSQMYDVMGSKTVYNPVPSASTL